jgi:regulator of sirC expression with transglutaminase-like and TPR domain
VEPRQRFEKLAALPDADLPLAEAALWIAAESRPEVDVAYRLDQLRTLSERIRPVLSSSDSGRQRVELLNRAFFQEEGFAGNSRDYSNPLNSFLDSVLDTRRGIPISLAIIYLEVAGRLGLPSAGVGFPGHFLVKVHAEKEEIIVDPFFGRILSLEDCEQRLQQTAGSEAALRPEMLDATPAKEILQRLLRNLKLLHIARKQYEDALACSERILLLAGEDLTELRDRGLIYRELECAGPALADLERYLAHAPQDPQTVELSLLVEELRHRVRQVH